MPARTRRPEGFFSVAELKARGWTDTLIRNHLGRPDATMPNPRFSSAAPMRLYQQDRVSAIEQSAQWSLLLEQAAQHKKAAASAVATKKQKLHDYLDTLDIRIAQLPFDLLIDKACTHYERRQEAQFADFSATKDSDPAFLSRITVNYLRHQLSSYETILKQTFGQVGVREAYLMINRKIYAAIAAAYPNLAEECDRQLALKLEQHGMAEAARSGSLY